MKKFTAAHALSNPKELKAFFDQFGFLHISQFYNTDICESAIEVIQNYEKSLTDSNNVEFVTENISGKCLIKYWQGIFGYNQSFRYKAELNKDINMKLIEWCDKNCEGKYGWYFKIKQPSTNWPTRERAVFTFQKKFDCVNFKLKQL